MQCWTWADVFCYFIVATLLLFWRLPPLGIIIAALKFPYFILIELPIGVALEFKVSSFERRRAFRPYSSFFEYAAIRFANWVLDTFRATTAGPIFFGETPARFLYSLRRCKYGNENIGDFEHKRANNYKSFKGYWVRSRCRADAEPDLVIYFVPGNLAGLASSYFYAEYLSMLLVELQVQGFANPVALVADIQYLEPGGYKAAFQQTYDGWCHLTTVYPNATSLVKGSGIGGTLLLTMLLHLERPFKALCPPRQSVDSHITPVACSTGLPGMKEDGELSVYEKVNEKDNADTTVDPDDSLPDESLSINDPRPGSWTSVAKPDAMLLISPLPIIASERGDNLEDLLGARALDQLQKHLVSSEEAREVWARPGNVRDDKWWAGALPTRGTVIMYGTEELLRRDIERLVNSMKSSKSLILADPGKDQLHGWPILASFISRSVTEQMAGIDQVADHIAKMLVMQCIGCHPPSI